ncbi:SDR family oxidoreductase (plasmid) [Sphingobium sp. RSMS]|uniref:SDR family NAD(P)-dependent oxidoreductase n=1 Tax=Sphingobium sp. RSMS TaxID=520734 RepID=UPI0010F8AB25|nr:SDR family oxidoreductase [Sphingobium sp. RSMS]UXC93824.1 SDR family oxidoreductase [Sphingobium sp. RSMS]
MPVSQFTDRVIVVTGGAGGMGVAITHTLIERGAWVVATDLREPRELVAGAEFIRHDVTSESDWDEVISRVTDRFGGLDGLVNNAGFAEGADLVDTSLAMFEKTMRVNQLGTFLGMRSAARAMMGKGGAIVNIASCVATRGVSSQFAYMASKWAVRGMTKGAAIELAPHGIRVNSINPGPTNTAMLSGWSDEQLNVFKGMVPMGRFGEPHEIAAVAAFLLSDEASYIAGAEVQADGGFFA